MMHDDDTDDPQEEAFADMMADGQYFSADEWYYFYEGVRQEIREQWWSGAYVGWIFGVSMATLAALAFRALGGL